MTYQFQFQAVWQNWEILRDGLILTLQISALSIAIGMSIGILGAVCRTSKNKLLGSLAAIYVEVIRNTPFLVQLLFIYFGISSLGPSIGSERAALMALSINFGAYATEIIRAGIQSIPQEQIQAGMSLGLNRFQIFHRIILKPAIANIYSALTGQIVLLILLSSVVSQISAEELTFAGNFVRSRTFRDFEVYIAIAIIYILIALSFKAIAYLLHQQFFKFTKYT
ncbi:MAG: amino acid ABC transporter permease [Cyanobacteria bacterium J06639_1]